MSEGVPKSTDFGQPNFARDFMPKTKNIACVILGAGRGTRMKSSIPKILHRISGKTIIEYVLELIKPFGFKPAILITGYKSNRVAQFAREAKIINQKRLLGSADAVMSARSALMNFKGDVVVICGDTPLIHQETLRQLIDRHKKTQAACTLLTAKMKDPAGYGRILRDDNDNIVRIVEENDASLYDKVIDEINVGTYCFDVKNLFEALKKVKANNKKNEYYLTDVIGILRKNNLKIESIPTASEEEALGVNSRAELSEAERILRNRALKKFLDNGVTIVDPANTYINIDCTIGKDTVIEPFTIIYGGVKIGANCTVGPFARIRTGVELADRVEIGNFVELTRSNIGSRTKIKHHSYIGDALIGKNVNIGAGTITANYDGKRKARTVIKAGAFIGSGTIFVAPVTVGRNAITGAGSVVTKENNVPDNAVVVGVPARILKRRRSS
jgi:bifunctional UDP-N-acetylglucosamine pyrophosphorylase/glucosamine-1-phosphate N-acetyltransferase